MTTPLKTLAFIASWLVASPFVHAQNLTLDDITKAGIDYMVTEYALDQVQYSACGLTLAKKMSPANFDKTKREFLSVFNDEARKKLDLYFHGTEMRGLKDAVSNQGILEPINKAKAQGKNMDAYCDREVDKLIRLNEQTRRNWFAVKAKIPG